MSKKKTLWYCDSCDKKGGIDDLKDWIARKRYSDRPCIMRTDLLFR